MTATDHINESTRTSSIADPFTARYVRIVGERHTGDVGYMFSYNGASDEKRPYNVGLWHAGGEDTFSAREMIKWLPCQGDRVVEIGEDDDYGTVLSSAKGITIVKWDSFIEPQEWQDDEIEPADTSASA